ncbi:MAG: preprotein translocase subunit TatA [Legionellales bacterium RIFCSPHIGHO2_12_FULL_35_11]|nr:MAG: preprotein translocase subunit TatA [Legionellales bacterium RIFCSPHIGHO2_12_FULL_35_11]
MGLSGVSPLSLILILLIILVLFGTKRIKNIGSDLGYAFRNFKKALNEDDKNSQS